MEHPAAASNDQSLRMPTQMSRGGQGGVQRPVEAVLTDVARAWL